MQDGRLWISLQSEHPIIDAQPYGARHLDLQPSAGVQCCRLSGRAAGCLAIDPGANGCIQLHRRQHPGRLQQAVRRQCGEGGRSRFRLGGPAGDLCFGTDHQQTEPRSGAPESAMPWRRRGSDKCREIGCCGAWHQQQRQKQTETEARNGSHLGMITQIGTAAGAGRAGRGELRR